MRLHSSARVVIDIDRRSLHTNSGVSAQYHDGFKLVAHVRCIDIGFGSIFGMSNHWIIDHYQQVVSAAVQSYYDS